MKPYPQNIISCLLLTFSLFLVSCDDWESGSQANFSSGVAQLTESLQDTTVSATYSGTLGGGVAVSNPWAGTITTLNISQSGSALTVTDNQGQSTWVGSVGEIMVEDVDPVFISNGQTIATWSVNWTGYDEVAFEQVVFSGNIELIFDRERTPNSYYVLSGTWQEVSTILGSTSIVAAEAPGPALNIL